MKIFKVFSENVGMSLNLVIFNWVVINRGIWHTINKENIHTLKTHVCNTFLIDFWPKSKKMPTNFTDPNHLYKTFSIFFWPKNKKTKSLAHFSQNPKLNSKPLFP